MVNKNQKQMLQLKLTPGERLKYVRNLLGISRPYVARKYNVSEITLRNWEKKESVLTQKALYRCIQYLQKEGAIVSKEWIESGEGSEPYIIQKHLKEQDIKPDQALLEDEDFCVIRDANNFKSSYNDAVIMLVTGNEMEPFYHEGDYVGGRFLMLDAKSRFIGRNCIVILSNGAKFFRRVFQASDETINLSCLNPTIPEAVLYNVKIDKIAPVIWHRQYYKI